MKSNRRNVLFLTPCVALGLFGFATVHAQTSRLNVPRVRFVAAITSSEFIVNGEVTERNEASFTVLSRTSELTTVLVTADTAITKGAVTIRLTDLAVGDKVSVTAVRSADGRLVAVSVAVRVGNE